MATVTFVLLGLAIIAVWAPLVGLPASSWVALLVLATVAGVFQGVVTWTAVFAVVLLCAMAQGSVRLRSPSIRAILTGTTALLALAMALHMVPGFRNPLLLDGVQVSAAAPLVRQYLNFDKGAAGLVLLAVYAPRLTRWEPSRVRIALAVTAATVVATFGVALTVAYVRPDPKVPAMAAAFLAVNLLFTCVAEEAFFRGLLQERLARRLERFPAGLWVAALVSAVLFGLGHGNGTTYTGLALLSGAGYATAYAFTGCIEAPILAHFVVNAVHFLGFTYPQLAA